MDNSGVEQHLRLNGAQRLTAEVSVSVECYCDPLYYKGSQATTFKSDHYNYYVSRNFLDNTPQTEVIQKVSG